MKKLLFISFISFSLSAQTVYETKIGKEKEIIKCDYLPQTNQLVIKEAPKKSNAYPSYNNALLVDEKGVVTPIIKNEVFNSLFFSLDNKDFSYQQIKSSSSPVKFNIGGKIISDEFKSDVLFKRFRVFKYKERQANFNSNTIYSVVNQDYENYNINIEKDLLVLEKYDFLKKSSKKITLPKPDLSVLQGKDLEQFDRIAFQVRFQPDNTFDIVTKSLSKDLTSSTIYRAVYDLEGKNINNFSYNVKDSNAGLVAVMTQSREENMWQAKRQMDIKPIDLDINDYYIDPTTQDFYIYGMSSSKKSFGFYLNRYKKSGEIIYEKFYPLDQKEAFSGKLRSFLLCNISLLEYNDGESLLVSVDTDKGFDDNSKNHIFLINKNSGSITKNVDYTNTVNSSKGTFSQLGSYSIFTNNKYKNKIFCSESVLSVLNVNDKVKSYIDKVSAKNDISFDCFINSKGIWLMETDNEQYYKVTLFKN